MTNNVNFLFILVGTFRSLDIIKYLLLKNILIVDSAAVDCLVASPFHQQTCFFKLGNYSSVTKFMTPRSNYF